jgi:ribonuclease G
MERIILINETDKGVRVAVVENGRPVEFYFDSKDEIPEDSIILGRVMEHAPALDAYFVDAGNEKKAYLPEKNKYEMNIKQNAIMPFQVLHVERGSKGMYLSCKLLVYGKYCICSNISKESRVSAKITDENEKKRLGDLIDSFSGSNREVIIRTVAQYTDSEEIKNDIQDCLGRLDDIESAAGNPGDILCNPDDLIDIIMKRYDPETDKVYFNEIDTFNRYYSKHSHNGEHRGIRHYNKDYDMFDFFSISTRLREAGSRRVRMKSGAELFFDYTEAMCVIDVNSSKNTSPSNFQDTALKTNLEAAEEIAVQLRLRNIGGIIVIDFIDTDEWGRIETDNYFRKCLEADSRRMQVGGFTTLGNYELIRSRKGRRLEIGQFK